MLWWILGTVVFVAIIVIFSKAMNWLTDIIYDKYFEKEYSQYDIEVDQDIWDEEEYE